MFPAGREAAQVLPECISEIKLFKATQIYIIYAMTAKLSKQSAQIVIQQ